MLFVAGVVGLESDVVVAEPVVLALVLHTGIIDLPHLQLFKFISDLFAIGGLLLLLLGTRGVFGGLSEVGEGVSTETRLASWNGVPSTDGSSSLDGALLLRL